MPSRDLRIEAARFKRRPEIALDKVAHVLAGPFAGGELLVGHRLVLHVHLPDRHALLRVRLDEFDEVRCIRAQDLVLHADRAEVIGRLRLHPDRRAPRRAEHEEVLLALQRFPDERDRIRLVAVDVEMLELEVVLHLVAGVPLHAEVVRADRHAAVIEVAVLRAEDLIHHGLAVRLGERLERVPAELVEAAAEALHGLRVAAGRLERILILRPGADGPRLPAVSLCAFDV